MKTKKKLDDYVQEDLSRYENAAFLERLKANVPKEKEEKRSRKTKHIVFSSVGAVILVIVCIGIFLWTPWKSAEPTTLEQQPSMEPTNENDTPSNVEKGDLAEERQYLFEDQVSEEISLAALQSELKQIRFSSGSLDRVMKVGNKQYDEILYYTLQYNFDDIEEIKIVIVTNKQYEYTFYLDRSYSLEAEVCGLEINYDESYTKEDEDLYAFEAKGEMLSEDGKIYVEYSGIWFEETSNFIPLLRLILE